MSMNIKDQLKEYVEELAKQDDIDPSINLFETGLLTSVHVLDLIAYIEEQFGIVISPDDLSIENFGSIDEMVTYVDKVMQPV